MGHRAAIFAIAAALLCVAVPLFIARTQQLGSFAKSPQRIEMVVGSSKLIAGGRAKMWFSSVDLGVNVEVSCKEGTKALKLALEGEAQEAFGLQIRLLDFKEAYTPIHRATFEISWK